MKLGYLYFLIVILFGACGDKVDKGINDGPSQQLNKSETPTTPYIVVLGVAQDAGYPQANCKKDCCKQAWLKPNLRKSVSCIALVEPAKKQAWIFDATPSFKDQLKMLESLGVEKIAGIFLTHAHIGHYTGLIHLGREVMGTKNIPVYAMPKMKAFLESNGPWSQLVSLNNIHLRELQNNTTVSLGNDLSVIPIQVPHRDEFSETVGFKIASKHQSAVFIPDIDKWEKWDQDIKSVIGQHDVALLDGSFYRNGEIWGRDMSLIPHPFITESMDLFESLPNSEKAKVYFIHFNHTNPVLQKESEAHKLVLSNGFGIAEEMQVFEL